ncbi:RWP-RK domain [Sesbania bispinosa]|nr:RWP-RK domain [Sesbania bispinosa]
MDSSPWEGFFEFNWTKQLPYQSKHLCFNEFTDLENFTFDFNLPPLYEDFEVDQKPLNIVVPNQGHSNNESDFVTFVKKEENQEVSLALQVTNSNRKKRSDSLEFDEIKKHFGVPITKAAKEMNVGLTLLKRRCRELNIRRWPHRKLKSLKLLIDNVKELGLANEVAMLEKHKMMLEKLPGMELNEETKKLRQACFKANYKRRRYLALQA